MEHLLKILDEGAFITCEEMAELAKQVRALQGEISFYKKVLSNKIEITPDVVRDAERYRWLTLYTSKLFMASEKGLNEQMDKAMGRGE